LARSSRFALLATAILAVLLPSAPARAAVFDVSNFEDLAPNGCTPGDCTLREAIIDANAAPGNDTILLDSGTYHLTRTGAADDTAAFGDLDVIRDGLDIVGRGSGETIVDAGEEAGLAERVFDIVYGGSGGQPAVSMSGLTITGGWANGPGEVSGGGINLEDGTLDLTDAGLIDNYGGSLGSGGGLQAETGTTATLRRVEVADNSTTNSGLAAGIMVDAAAVTIDDSAIHGNRAMYNGGAIVQQNGTLIVRNTTMSGNSATENGGAIHMFSGTADLNNVTITGNAADVDENGSGTGGGIRRDNGTLTIRNSIVARNVDRSPPGEAPSDCSGTISSQGYNLVGTDLGCTFTASTGDQVGSGGGLIDPKLGPLADNGGPTPTHALLRGSPAIDAGNPAPPGSGGAACEATDQRGIPRNGCDIGAYELVFCAKVPVNRIGTERKDKLRGTPGSDGMLGLGGNDTLKGKGGKDGLCGGGGKDKLQGGGGKDRLKGQGGKDTCAGGGGKDKATCEKETKVP
jgi:hypothetical protein